MTIKTPQDHKKKTGEDRFSFVHKGKTYTMVQPVSLVQAPKYMRQNRRRSDIDLTFTMIEDLSDNDPDILKAIDDMTPDEFNRLSNRLGRALSDAADTEALGESEAS